MDEREQGARATIAMTARESALYNVGMLLGTAHGLERAAEMVRAVVVQVRAWPAGLQNAAWCEQAALTILNGKGGAKRANLAQAFREFGGKLAQGQNEIGDWLESCAKAIAVSAVDHRAQFAELLAAIEPDEVRQPGGVPAPGGPHKARPRAKTLGVRILERVVDGARDVLENERKKGK